MIANRLHLVNVCRSLETVGLAFNASVRPHLCDPDTQSWKATVTTWASPTDRRDSLNLTAKNSNRMSQSKARHVRLRAHALRFPTQERRSPLFFRKSFFHSHGDKYLTAAPSGPSTPPPVGSPRQLRTWVTQEVASSLNRFPFPRLR